MSAAADTTPSPDADPPVVLGAAASFEGLLTFKGSARIDGELRGDVVAEGLLVIGPGGRVTANVEVDELVVGGVIDGDVVARERVEVLAGARVVGSLRSPRLTVADGATLLGRCQTSGPAADPGRGG